jgi:hypothetical protein
LSSGLWYSPWSGGRSPDAAAPSARVARRGDDPEYQLLLLPMSERICVSLLEPIVVEVAMHLVGPVAAGPLSRGVHA